jgi:TraY domain
MPKTRKRAAGAGRKPKGEFTGKTATITTRIQPDTRDALEEAAQTSGRSLSQEVEFRLKAGLRKPIQSERRNQALGQMIAFTADWIEKAAGRSWRDDPFTGQALWHAVEALAFYLGPDVSGESIEVPPLVTQSSTKMPPELAGRFCTARGFGHLNAQFVINEIEQAARPPAPPDEWSTPIFSTAHESVLGSIGRDLGLVAKKNSEK